MAGLTVIRANMDGPKGRQRRNSYFEVLSSVSSDLDFMASDLRKAQVPFKASSPKSPLAVSVNVPIAMQDETVFQIPSVDRYQHLREARNYSLGTNNNASTISTMPTMDYSQLPMSRGVQAFNKSLILPVSPLHHPGSIHEGFINPHHHPSHHGDESMELSLLTRLVHTKPIWFLPNTPRTAAIHYLQGQPVGTFVVCQSRDKDNLVLAMKHPGKGTGLYIEKLPIHISQNGVKLSNSSEFSSIEDLILHNLYHEGVLPCKLALAPEIMTARNIRALQSLALFEEEFWVRNQSRLGIPAKQEEVQKASSRLLGSPRGWSTFPLSSGAQHQHPIPSLSSSMAPRLPSPKGYMVMNKQPTFTPQTTAAAKMSAASSNLMNTEQGVPSVSMRNVDSIAAKTRCIHKSWSFGDKNNPFRESEFLSANRTVDGRQESIDDTCTLLSRSGRQPIRCSTQSQQEFLMQNLGNYPPPLHSPPPPPKETLPALYSIASQQSPVTPPLVQRSSAEYYRPFESTRQGHHPPSAFGFEALLLSQTPPPLPTRSISHPPQGIHYQQPVTAPSLPTQFSQYSSPSVLPKPLDTGGNYSKLEAQLDSLKRTSSLESKVEPSQQHQLTFGSIEGQQNLAPILQPSVSVTCTPPPSSEQILNPLLEFDPLLAPSRPKETSLSSMPHPSQDVFSAAPKPTSPVQFAPESHYQPFEMRYPALIGKLLNLTVDSSEDEEQTMGEPKSAVKTGGTDCSSEEWDQTGDDDDDEEEEEDRIRGDQSSSTGDIQSSHSSETQSQVGDTVQETKMTALSDDDHSERNVDKLSEVTLSQTKKIKKLKKKKISKLTKIQKYVLRSKTKKKNRHGDPVEEIQAAIHKLASNKNSYFSMMMECFVQNVKDKDEEERPDVMIRNLRQFMSGMKNYLFNRREPEIDAAMDKYYNLTMAELDAIVEGAIYSYILLPLKQEIYKCFITEHKESGSLDVLDHNIQLARAKTPQELGIKPNYTPPAGESLEKIRKYFHLLGEAYSPIKKLQHLLDIVRTVYDTVVDKNSSRGQAVQSMGADDFLPMFIYVLVQCEVVDIEIEANYMWGLLEPTMLSGEGGYYLTTLSSAICVLKQFEKENEHTETKGFLSVMVALGDAEDNVVHKTLPVRPGMNAGDVSRILAHKMKIDNSHQYQLYLLSGEEETPFTETPIADNECPLDMKENKAGQTRVCFGYKKENRPVKWFQSS